MRHDNANLQGNPNLHKTITDIKSNPTNGVIVIADGIPHVIRGGNNVPYVAGTGLGYSGPFGAMNMHEIPLPPTESGTVQDIGVYGQSAYILFSNGNLYTVGINTKGQLGLGDTTERTVYTLSNTGVTRVYTNPSNGDRNSGVDSRLIIQKSDNKIYGCGYNLYGQLGLGNTTEVISSWTELTWCGTSPLSVWNMGTTIGCTYCQRSDGTVFATGWNNEGQLGNGSTAVSVSTPVNVTNNWLGGTYAATGMVIQQVLGGYGFFDGATSNESNTTMFMDNGTTSRIASAGSNTWGALGDGTTTNRSTPVTASVYTGRVQQIGRTGGGAAASVYVLRTDGTVWDWGRNVEGQLGRGNTTSPIATPAQVATGVVRMLNEYYATTTTAYRASSPILETTSSYLITGYNAGGALGVGDATDRTTFTQMRFPSGTRLDKVGSMSTINELQSRYATDTNGNFYAWGENSNNGVADTNTTDVAVPIKITPTALIR